MVSANAFEYFIDNSFLVLYIANAAMYSVVLHHGGDDGINRKTINCAKWMRKEKGGTRSARSAQYFNANTQEIHRTCSTWIRCWPLYAAPLGISGTRWLWIYRQCWRVKSICSETLPIRIYKIYIEKGMNKLGHKYFAKWNCECASGIRFRRACYMRTVPRAVLLSFPLWMLNITCTLRICHMFTLLLRDFQIQ